MLGVIHRAVLGKGPEQVRKYFARSDAPKHPEGRQALRRHSKQLDTYRNGKFLDTTAFSLLGLIDVYNLLPEEIVQMECVHKFQRGLQDILKLAISNGLPKWEMMFSPRITLHLHPLRMLLTECKSGGHGEGDMEPAVLVEPAAPRNNCISSWLRFGHDVK